MLYYRLGAAGAPRNVAIGVLAELWLAYAVAVGILSAISWLTGPGEASSASGELHDFAMRWAKLGSQGRALFSAGAAVAIGVFIYALVMVRRTMRKYPLR